MKKFQTEFGTPESGWLRRVESEVATPQKCSRAPAIFSGVHLAPLSSSSKGGMRPIKQKQKQTPKTALDCSGNNNKNRTLTAAVVVRLLPVGLPSLSLLGATEAAAEESERVVDGTRDRDPNHLR